MEQGSLSAAARALALSQPTVRRQIETLETQVGARLFTRASNGLSPTPMALDLLPLAQSVTSEAEAFARAASGAAGAKQGTVRLTASRVLAVHCLPLLLPALHAKAPGITIELTATDQTENMARRAADIALRVVPPVQEALVAQKLPPIRLGLFATAGLARTLTNARLTTVPFISDDRTRQIEAGLEALGHPVPRQIVLRSDDALVQIAAIQTGLGVGICQVAVAERLGLVRMFATVETTLPCYLVMHEDQAQIARIRTVFDHFAQCLPEHL